MSNIELVLHLGTGKTGTTSIQTYLESESENLSQNKIFYAGLMLEHSPVKRFDWQDKFGTGLFRQQRPNDRIQQLREATIALIDYAIANDYNKIIWSNEALFDMDDIQDAFKSLPNTTITLVAFLRRHDAWIISAYKQWGIKHKTYLGPVRKFSDWVKTFNFKFGAKLKLWSSIADNIVTRNYDKYKSVVNEFCDIIEFRKPATVTADKEFQNRSYTPEELAISAIVNSQRHEKGIFHYSSHVAHKKLLSTEWFQALFATQEDVNKIFAETAKDREELNKYLAKDEQFDVSEPIKVKTISEVPNYEDIYKKLILFCADKIQEREKTIAHLEKRIIRLEQKLNG